MKVPYSCPDGLDDGSGDDRGWTYMVDPQIPYRTSLTTKVVTVNTYSEPPDSQPDDGEDGSVGMYGGSLGFYAG